MANHFILKIPAIVLGMICHASAAVAEPVTVLDLQNAVLKVQITPDIGGRLLWFSRTDQPNILKIGDAVVTNPHPAVDTNSKYIPYYGHEVWAGPQGQWWLHQTVNIERARAADRFPPDPYGALATNKILESSSRKIVLQGPASPVSGLQMTKSYEFDTTSPDKLHLNVTAKNTRSTNIAWDIWFNTRVHADTHIYVPVTALTQIRATSHEDDTHAALVPSLQDHLLTIDRSQSDKVGRHGKLYIQPAGGWVAAFREGQLFIVQFPLHPTSSIHPEQAQVEIYNNYSPSSVENGVLEIEVHAPYKKLRPAQTMSATETWIIVDYKGAATPEAERAFLISNAKKWGLTGL